MEVQELKNGGVHEEKKGGCGWGKRGSACGNSKPATPLFLFLENPNKAKASSLFFSTPPQLQPLGPRLHRLTHRWQRRPPSQAPPATTSLFDSPRVRHPCTNGTSRARRRPPPDGRFCRRCHALDRDRHRRRQKPRKFFSSFSFCARQMLKLCFLFSGVAPTTSASFLDHRGQGRHRSVAVVNWNTIGDSSSALSFLTLTWLNPSTSSRTTRIKATKLRLAGGNAAGDDFISLTVLCFRLDACDWERDLSMALFDI